MEKTIPKTQNIVFGIIFIMLFQIKYIMKLTNLVVYNSLVTEGIPFQLNRIYILNLMHNDNIVCTSHYI